MAYKKELKNKILEMYKAKKKTRDEIEVEYGLNKHTLKQWVYESGSKIWDTRAGAQRENYGKELIREIMNLYRKKLSTRDELMKKYKVNRKTIDRWLRERGIPLWDRKHRKLKLRNGQKHKSSRRGIFSWKDMEKSIMYNYNRN